MTACTLVTSHIGPQDNAQAVAWNGQMVNIITALRHLHDISLHSPLSHHTLGSLCHLHDISLHAPLSHHTLVPKTMLKWWPGMVKWSISSLLIAISMIYHCIHPCHITPWALISMIYDCMHPCHITVQSLLFAIFKIYHHCSSPSP